MAIFSNFTKQQHEVDIVEVVEEEPRPDDSQIEFVIDDSEVRSWH